MKHTFHPDVKKYKTLVKGYTRLQNGRLEFEASGFQNSPAAGGFISTAEDLMLWNQHLHNGKLLREETYKRMITKQDGAVRSHPIFGTSLYGYGITVTETSSVLQLGQTGFAPGFVSMDFYFPGSETSVIVLQNVVYDRSDLMRSFHYHIEILKLFKDNIIKK